ncbi:MAG: TlpA family protein disulfide reductase [Proteobacteria bacterium]|nr:TlpA family protein disulfide reductase [Pseudomonadota bacterium]
MRTKMGAALALTLSLVACGRGPDGIQPGTYRVVLQLPGGELPFGLDLERAQGAWSGHLINGPERVELSEVAVNGSHLEIRMPGFENRLIADGQEGRLTGEMIISKPEGKDQHLPLSGRFKQTYRFFPPARGSGLNVSGRWSVTFTAQDGQEEAAVGEFSQAQDIVTGTFLTNGGDHRYLAGQVQGNELYLSTFDGAHAFLYKAKVTGTDGGLAGDFWSGSALHERWVAKRDEHAALPDAYSVTAMREQEPKFEFAFPDLAGNTVTSKDAKFQGKVLVIALGGSWCPNCHDEAAFLQPLYREYRDQGLEIVALMFEHFGDFKRAVAATRRFREQYGIEYTTLIAGVSDLDEAAKKLPMLQKFYGFPTTVIVARNGQVRKIHTGFSGPATGEHYKQLTDEFRNNLNQLLAER